MELWATYRWCHICIAYDKKLSTLRFVKDGKPLNLNHRIEMLNDVQIPPDFLNKTYLGRCSFDFKKTCSAPELEIADYNVWDRSLSVVEMVEFTTCKSMRKGNVINWDKAEFDLVNMRVLEYSEEDVCVPPKPGDVMFPELRNFTAHAAICRLMRGRPTVVTSQEQQTRLVKEFSNYPNCGNPKDRKYNT